MDMSSRLDKYIQVKTVNNIFLNIDTHLKEQTLMMLLRTAGP